MASESLLVFDRTTGALAYLNAEASAFFELRGVPLERARAADILPELSDLTPRRFESRVRIAGVAHDVTVRLEDLRAGPFTPPAATAVTVTMRGQYAAVRSERLEALWDLVVTGGFAGADQICAILREALRGVGFERATLGRLTGDVFTAAFTDAGAATQTDPLVQATAAATARSAYAYVSLETPQGHRDEDRAARCVSAVRFTVKGEPYVLAFSSTVPREEARDPADVRYLDTVVETLSRSVERLQSDARIEALAYSDALTSLPNRSALLRRIDDAVAEAQALAGRTALLFVDIDGFKMVNDTIGHGGGDVVLAEVAQRLRGALRREEYIGRLGGDEFAIVIPRVGDRDDVESIAQRLTSILAFPFRAGDDRFALSASIGVALYPDDATDRDELLACGDAAMYAAKEAGGSRVRFYDETLRRPRTKRGAASPKPPPPYGRELPTGYVLRYRPILDARSGAVLAAEALLKRELPSRGFLAPQRASATAGDSSAGRALDRWALHEAMRQACRWHSAGTPVPVDVRLAAFDTHEIDAILADAAGAGNGNRIRVQFATAQFLEPENAARLTAFITYCGTREVAVVLDDFDGNFSLLGTLARTAIVSVKLDPSLVRSVLNEGPGRAIISATVLVAKSLGWSVIAKGVDTVPQQEAVVSLGCDGISGTNVAHTMTATDLTEWLGYRRLLGREA